MPFYIKSSKLVVAVAAIFIVGNILSLSLSNRVYGESGVGKDIFKVVVSIFGMTSDTGDIIATVNVNGHSKVRFFGLSQENLTSAQNSSTQRERILTFAASFPGLLVNPGDSYKACVITLNDMHVKCNEGHNSPASRPEFVDISLGKGTKGGSGGKGGIAGSSGTVGRDGDNGGNGGGAAANTDSANGGSASAAGGSGGGGGGGGPGGTGGSSGGAGGVSVCVGSNCNSIDGVAASDGGNTAP